MTLRQLRSRAVAILDMILPYLGLARASYVADLLFHLKAAKSKQYELEERLKDIHDTSGKA